MVTARRARSEDARGTSWLTLASQMPFGMALAVVKVRSPEPRFRVGDALMASFLEEGRSQGPMNYFPQKFAPEVNRQEGAGRIACSNQAAVCSARGHAHIH